MLPPKSLLDNLGAQINRLLNDSHTAEGPIESRLRPLLQGAFNHLDLVSRKEFDRQTVALEHTRLCLEALERRLQELEARLP